MLTEPLRLNLARRRHDRLEVARLDDVGRDRQPLVLLEVEVGADDGAADEDDHDRDEARSCATSRLLTRPFDRRDDQRDHHVDDEQVIAIGPVRLR